MLMRGISRCKRYFNKSMKGKGVEMKKTKRITSIILCVIMFLSVFIPLVGTREEVQAATVNQRNKVLLHQLRLLNRHHHR